MPHKKAISEKNNRKYHFSRRQRRKILGQKTDTGTTTEATEPFEVDRLWRDGTPKVISEILAKI
jgi:hypothetical protein